MRAMKGELAVSLKKEQDLALEGEASSQENLSFGQEESSHCTRLHGNQDYCSVRVCGDLRMTIQLVFINTEHCLCYKKLFLTIN